MYFKYTVLLVVWIAVVCQAKTKDEVKKDILLLKDYVLVPVQYADKMLADHLEKIQEMKEGSFAALSDVISNQDEFTAEESAQILAKVLEEGVQVLRPALKDVRALLFPNTALKQQQK